MLPKKKHIILQLLFPLLLITFMPPPAESQRGDRRYGRNEGDVPPFTGEAQALKGTSRLNPHLLRELRVVMEKDKVPRGALRLVKSRSGFNFDKVMENDPNGLVILRFHAPSGLGYSYIAWNRANVYLSPASLEGSFWKIEMNGDTHIQNIKDLKIDRNPAFLLHSPPQSPVIESVKVTFGPKQPFKSDGDLWMSTWADDGNLYTGWGDGYGVSRRPDPMMYGSDKSDCGIAKLSGSLPKLKAEEVKYVAPTNSPDVDDKPSSLICIGGRLYGHFHSPLGSPWIGYIAYSDDHGKSWQKSGYYSEWDERPENASPWTLDWNSPFRCMFFVNMGKNYELNEDGYVYALATGQEYNWEGGVRLTRVPKDRVLIYEAYEYYVKTVDGVPIWSKSQFDAKPIPGINCFEQGSVMYHPYLKRYLFLTTKDVYDAPNPWGPWTLAGRWQNDKSSTVWRDGYQPGIISKDTGPDYFWFTMAGTGDTGGIGYEFNLGKIEMELR